MSSTTSGPTSLLSALEFLKNFREDPLATALSLKQQYGDVVRMPIGPVDWYILSHPNYVRDVLVVHSKQFGKTEAFKRILGTVDGNGLVMSEGEFWLRQRRIIQPGFHHDRLSMYAEVMVDKTKAVCAGWVDGNQLDLSEEMTKIALSIIAKLLFGIEVGEQAKVLGDAVTSISEVLYQEFSDIVPIPEWMPLKSKKKKRAAVRILDQMIHKAIEQHGSKDEGDMLSMLLLSVDHDGDGKGMTLEQVRDEAITLFNAGHDSTAAALSWTWYALLTHPAVYKQLLETVDSTFADRLPTMGDLIKAPLLQSVSKESMRLYPPVWIIPRQCNETTEVGGHTIKKGSLVNLFPYIIQRDERFFAEPLHFLPERFDPGKEQHDSFSYFPFGAGPRACIGREFALMEMQLILAAISQEFTFELAQPDETVAPNPLVSLEPGGGVKVIAHRRKPNSNKT